MLPSAEALHLQRVRRNLSGAVSEQDLEGNRNPQGGAAEAEERAAAGRMKSPDAVPEQRRDTGTADTSQSKVFICTLAAEVEHNCSLIRAGISGTRTAQFATVVARRKDDGRGVPKEREQVG
jgi:hypothetical protein